MSLSYVVVRAVGPALTRNARQQVRSCWRSNLEKPSCMRALHEPPPATYLLHWDLVPGVEIDPGLEFE